MPGAGGVHRGALLFRGAHAPSGLPPFCWTAAARPSNGVCGPAAVPSRPDTDAVLVCGLVPRALMARAPMDPQTHTSSNRQHRQCARPYSHGASAACVSLRNPNAVELVGQGNPGFRQPKEPAPPPQGW